MERANSLAIVSLQKAGQLSAPLLWQGALRTIRLCHRLRFVKTTRTAGSPIPNEAYDFRAFLCERFRSAAHRNARFSLRSFARRLGMNHSTLSQIMRSKRRLTPHHVRALGGRLGLSEDLIEIYESGLKSRTNETFTTPEIRRVSLDLDTFQLVSLWYHQAILELTHVRGFKPDTRWIAKTLRVSVEEVNIALQRMLRLRLLEMAGRKHWLDKSSDAEFHCTALTETASNEVNQKVHELAIEAIRRFPARKRVHSSMVVAINSMKIPQLEILSEKFMNDIRSLLSDNTKNDDVYYAEVSLFPLTTLKAKGNQDDA